jgi:hypothetical protein
MTDTDQDRPTCDHFSTGQLYPNADPLLYDQTLHTRVKANLCSQLAKSRTEDR